MANPVTIGMAVGAIGGSMLDDENPMRGATLGAVTGGAGGAFYPSIAPALGLGAEVPAATASGFSALGAMPTEAALTGATAGVNSLPSTMAIGQMGMPPAASMITTTPSLGAIGEPAMGAGYFVEGSEAAKPNMFQNPAFRGGMMMNGMGQQPQPQMMAPAPAPRPMQSQAGSFQRQRERPRGYTTPMPSVIGGGYYG
jgi:hypothetical protein